VDSFFSSAIAAIAADNRSGATEIAERAADILLEQAGGKAVHDVWTLAESLEAQRVITQHMIQERRRVRS